MMKKTLISTFISQKHTKRYTMHKALMWLYSLGNIQVVFNTRSALYRNPNKRTGTHRMASSSACGHSSCSSSSKPTASNTSNTSSEPCPCSYATKFCSHLEVFDSVRALKSLFEKAEWSAGLAWYTSTIDFDDPVLQF